jgi:hypothetical protein
MQKITGQTVPIVAKIAGFSRLRGVSAGTLAPREGGLAGGWDLSAWMDAARPVHMRPTASPVRHRASASDASRPYNA